MGLPESGPASVSVSGQSIFPLYNNVGSIAMADCEMDLCSAHAGQGFDYHYHGDPFHPVAGTCMYSPADYTSDTAHPPLIGWGLDGYEIYGRHLNISNLGYEFPLDDCGGHIHPSSDGITPMTYHYHSQIINTTNVAGEPYYAYIAGVNNCWRGNISQVEFFGNSVAFESRPDFDMLKPCCGTTEYYANGVTLTGATTSTSSPTVKPNASPSASPVNTKSPTVKPTVSLSPSHSPSTVAPSHKPSALPSVHPSFKPSTHPSAVPTFVPSNQNAAVVTMSASATVSGVQTDSLTSDEETAVVNATASSLGVSTTYVTYTGTAVVSTSSRRLKGVSVSSTTYTITLNTQLVLPLINYHTTDENEAIEALTSAFNSATTNGEFLEYLRNAAEASGSDFASSGIAMESHSLSVVAVDGPPTQEPTSKPGSNSVLSGTILYVVIAVAGAVFLLIVLYCVQLYLGSRSVPEGYNNPPENVKPTTRPRSNSKPRSSTRPPKRATKTNEEMNDVMSIEQVYRGDGKVGF